MRNYVKEEFAKVIFRPPQDLERKFDVLLNTVSPTQESCVCMHI